MSSPELQALAAARARVGLVAFLIALAVLAWWSTVRAMTRAAEDPHTVLVEPAARMQMIG